MIIVMTIVNRLQRSSDQSTVCARMRLYVANLRNAIAVAVYAQISPKLVVTVR